MLLEIIRTMNFRYLCLVCLGTFSAFAVASFSPHEAYAGCNNGLGTLDPTCPGRIFNPQPSTYDPLQEEAELYNPYNPLRSAGVDLGYDHLPRAFIDVNGDGRADYCRFAGDAPNIFIACVLASRSTPKWSTANQFSFRSINGIDQGYDTLPRGFRAVNGKVAYCRFVGNAPNIFEACNLTTSTGFSSDQLGYRTGRTRSSAVAR